MARHGCAALALLCASSLPLPLAAVTSQSFQVSATITAGCLVVGGVSNYGSLNFGSLSALATNTVQVSLSGGVQLRHMQLTTGSNRVAYSLFRDAAFSQSLGIGQSVAVAYTDANNISLPIYGQVQLPGNQPGGTYSDVLQVQLSW